MNKKTQASRVVLYQNLGFLGLMLLFFLDEMVRLPTLVFSDHPFAFLIQRPTLELLLTLAVWYLVHISTRRILAHLHYLEKFLRVCAWCRRINYQGEWMRLEEFMQQGFDTPTTHGICNDCLSQQMAAVEKANAARQAKMPPPV